MVTYGAYLTNLFNKECFITKYLILRRFLSCSRLRSMHVSLFSPSPFQQQWAYENGLRKAEAIIHNNLKAIRHIDITTGVRTWELYDLDKDPSEKNNIAREPQYAKIKRKMFRRLTLIGPCPNRDRKKPFILRHGPMKGKSVTCNFFNKKEKCDVYFIDGERFCQSKCNRHKLVCKH